MLKIKILMICHEYYNKTRYIIIKQDTVIIMKRLKSSFFSWHKWASILFYAVNAKYSIQSSVNTRMWTTSCCGVIHLH